jgi:hypothetical protein
MAKINTDTFKGHNPYLNAPRGKPIGYKSCTWRRDDRILSVCCEVVGVLIYILLAAGVVYIVV